MAVDQALYQRLRDGGFGHKEALILADPQASQYKGGLLGGDGGDVGGGETVVAAPDTLVARRGLPSAQDASVFSDSTLGYMDVTTGKVYAVTTEYDYTDYVAFPDRRDVSDAVLWTDTSYLSGLTFDEVTVTDLTSINTFNGKQGVYLSVKGAEQGTYPAVRGAKVTQAEMLGYQTLYAMGRADWIRQNGAGEDQIPTVDTKTLKCLSYGITIYTHFDSDTGFGAGDVRLVTNLDYNNYGVGDQYECFATVKYADCQASYDMFSSQLADFGGTTSGWALYITYIAQTDETWNPSVSYGPSVGWAQHRTFFDRSFTPSN